MRIDTHVHTTAISLCAEVTCYEVADLYKKAGYGGLVLTNHYSHWYMEVNHISYNEWLERFLTEWRDMAAYGKKIGLKVFLGAEVTLRSPYADYLLFGADEPFFLEHPRLFDLDQKQLYLLCEQCGILLVQAHPFRVEHGHRLQNAKYLHGLEINCHPSFCTEEQRVLETAAQRGMIVTAGSDVHQPHMAAQCALDVPDSIEDAAQLAAHLREVRLPTYHIYRDSMPD